jgi:hypothetical protein
MKTLIAARPYDFIKRSQDNPGRVVDFSDVVSFYELLPEACRKVGIKCVIKDVPAKKIMPYGDQIYLGHHTKGQWRNCWHIKKGYLPGYLYFDKRGYSGWAERNYDPTKTYPDMSHVWKQFRDNRVSKLDQPTSANIPNEPYVLFLGQMPNDSVQDLAFVPMMRAEALVNRVVSQYCKVFTKPHPKAANLDYSAEIINGNLHDLIKGSSAVFTVNSGSGFEALLHQKSVFTFGKSDYDWVTWAMLNEQMFENVFDENFLGDRSGELIHNFLNYCFSEKFVDAYSVESICKKLQRTLDEYSEEF